MKEGKKKIKVQGGRMEQKNTKIIKNVDMMNTVEGNIVGFGVVTKKKMIG